MRQGPAVFTRFGIADAYDLRLDNSKCVKVLGNGMFPSGAFDVCTSKHAAKEQAKREGRVTCSPGAARIEATALEGAPSPSPAASPAPDSLQSQICKPAAIGNALSLPAAFWDPRKWSSRWSRVGVSCH